LRVPNGCYAAAYYANMKQTVLTFLESYWQEQFFQISVQGVETATWWFQESVTLRMKNDVHLRNARARLRKILLSCYSSHVL
jgi:hypothetical protein